MGMKYAGWICGMIALFLCAAVTGWTAKILAKCMDLDPTLITFSDLAYISFGRNARIATSVLFTLELLAACVALIVLFADSLDLLFPGVFSVTGWKVFCAIILVPLNFLPLRLLSFTSVIGIFSCFTSKFLVNESRLGKGH
jgi:vesicular inhibitory amino acid transporter